MAKLYLMLDLEGPAFKPTEHDTRMGIMKTMAQIVNNDQGMVVPSGHDNINGKLVNEAGAVIGEWMIK